MIYVIFLKSHIKIPIYADVFKFIVWHWYLDIKALITNLFIKPRKNSLFVWSRHQPTSHLGCQMLQFKNAI